MSKHIVNRWSGSQSASGAHVATVLRSAPVGREHLPPADTTRAGRREYTLADCACEYCLYYGGKKKGCQLEECCCAEEIKEAREREKFEK